MACIGLGGQGHIDLFNLLQFDELQIVAVCDVDREAHRLHLLGLDAGQGAALRRARAGATQGRRALCRPEEQAGVYKGCRAYADYRELLDREDVDAVVVATPDHNHAVVTMAAIKRGKHVYCEKPLTYSVHEARQVAEAARKAGVATQLGNQGQATEEARLVQEFILDGAIGPVHEVHVALGHRFWDPPKWPTRPPETPPVPDGLDWDLWLGPAPARPYHPAYHPLVLAWTGATLAPVRSATWAVICSRPSSRP